MGRASPPHRLTYELDVRGLGALGALRDLVLDLRALGERPEALALDAAEVDEDVLRAVVRGDEPVPLLVAEPLDGSGCHAISPPSADQEQVREAVRHSGTRSCVVGGTVAVSVTGRLQERS